MPNAAWHRLLQLASSFAEWMICLLRTHVRSLLTLLSRVIPQIDKSWMNLRSLLPMTTMSTDKYVNRPRSSGNGGAYHRRPPPISADLRRDVRCSPDADRQASRASSGFQRSLAPTGMPPIPPGEAGSLKMGAYFWMPGWRGCARLPPTLHRSHWRDCRATVCCVLAQRLQPLWTTLQVTTRTGDAAGCTSSQLE